MSAVRLWEWECGRSGSFGEQCPGTGIGDIHRGLCRQNGQAAQDLSGVIARVLQCLIGGNGGRLTEYHRGNGAGDDAGQFPLEIRAEDPVHIGQHLSLMYLRAGSDLECVDSVLWHKDRKGDIERIDAFIYRQRQVDALLFQPGSGAAFKDDIGHIRQNPFAFGERFGQSQILFHIRIAGSERGSLLEGFQGNVQITGIGRVIKEEKSPDVRGKGIDIIRDGFQFFQVGVETVHLVVDPLVRDGLSGLAAAAQLLLFLFDLFGVPGDSIPLALIGFIQMHTGGVLIALNDVVYPQIGADHDAVGHPALVSDIGRIAESGERFLSQMETGGIVLEIPDHLIRDLKRARAVLQTVVDPESRSLLQPPDQSVLAFGLFVGLSAQSGLSGIEIAGMIILMYLSGLVLVTDASGQRQNTEDHPQKDHLGCAYHSADAL